MKKLSSIVCLSLIFLLFSSCERPDLTDDVEWAYDYASRNNSGSGSSSEGSTSEDSSSGSCTTIDGNMWSPKSSYRRTWNTAVDYCNNLTECGYSDWRLPNINELRTLIKNCPGSQTGGACAVKDPDCLSGSCLSDDCLCEYRGNNGGYYSKLGDNENVDLWSSSVRSEYSIRYRWYVDFFNGNVNYSDMDNGYYVRCVR